MPKFEVIAVSLPIFILIVNRNKDSYWLNEDAVDPAIKTTVNMLHNFTLPTTTLSKRNSQEHSINFVFFKTPIIEISDNQKIKDT